MWREEARLSQLRNNAQEQLREAERNLASTMDKVSATKDDQNPTSNVHFAQDTGSGLQAVDRIAERLQLDGVYGPLYRLFEVVDQNYNTAIELTAGAR
jgi:structural maintenance of chromosome 3 (chondroitin sulfate proteoglycan 6)